MTSPRPTARDIRGDMLATAALAVVGLAAGLLVARGTRVAIVLAGTSVFLALVVRKPVLAAALALPGLYAFQSVGLGGGLGASDVLIIAASALAIPVLTQEQHASGIRPIRAGFVVYVALLLPSLAANFSGAALREVVHRTVIVAGATLVGAWLAREHAHRLGLRLLVIASSVMAIVCMADTASRGFAPATPLGYNKNYVGSLLALVLILVLCAPDFVGVAKTWRLPTIALLILGTLSCQSRGAILGAATGGLVWLFAPRQGTGVNGRNRVAALVLAVGFAGYTGYSLQQQLTSSNRETNSAGVRFNVEAVTRDIWRTSPAVGVGLRYFNTGNFGPLAINANNAYDNELAESGLFGAAGFTVLQGATMIALWRRRRSQLGIAALALTVGAFVHGQFDIYWSSGVTPLPFLVAGIALSLPRSD